VKIVLRILSGTLGFADVGMKFEQVKIIENKARKQRRQAGMNWNEHLLT